MFSLFFGMTSLGFWELNSGIFFKGCLTLSYGLFYINLNFYKCLHSSQNVSTTFCKDKTTRWLRHPEPNKETLALTTDQNWAYNNLEAIVAKEKKSCLQGAIANNIFHLSQLTMYWTTLQPRATESQMTSQIKRGQAWKSHNLWVFSPPTSFRSTNNRSCL